jgi:SAM-dependent methyltransferase
MMRSDMFQLLACPDDGGEINTEGNSLTCLKCGRYFRVEYGIVHMQPLRLERPIDDCDLQKLREQRTRDEQAGWYDRLIGLKLVGMFELPVYRRLLGDLSYGVALEVGCGTGRVTVELMRRCERLFALDLSYASLLRCMERIRQARNRSRCNWLLLHGDANSIPLREGTCDLVFSAQAIEHIPGKQLQCAAFKEIARVLKEGAPFVFSIYHWSWLMKLFSKREGYHRGGIYFYRWTADELREALSTHFEVDYLRPCAGYILIVKAIKR